jgi:hypothetical protein
MKATHYERLFLLNRCLEQLQEILAQFHQEGLIRSEFAESRKHIAENLRADLSHVLTGLLHQRELEECVALAQIQIEQERRHRGSIDATDDHHRQG